MGNSVTACVHILADVDIADPTSGLVARGKKPRGGYMKSFGPIDRKHRGGKHGAVRSEGVLVGYSETSPSVRAWNPWRGKHVLNVA